MLSALHNRQLLSFTVTRVSRTHGILHHTVIVCQLIISSAAVPSVSHSFGCSIQTRQSIHLTVTPNLLHSVAMAAYYCVSNRKSKEPFTGRWGELLFLPSRQVSTTYNLTHAVLDSTRTSTDGETSAHFDTETLDHWQEVGLFDFSWQRGNPPPFLFPFHLAEIFTEHTPIHLQR